MRVVCQVTVVMYKCFDDGEMQKQISWFERSNYHDKALRPLALLLASTFWPVLDLRRAKNPWRRLRTRQLGLNVCRFPQSPADAEKARIDGESEVFVDCNVDLTGLGRTRESEVAIPPE